MMTNSSHVHVDTDRVQLSLTLVDERIRDHFTAVPDDRRVAEAERILRLGVDTATQVGVRAEAMALDQARQRITAEAEAVRRQLADMTADTQQAWRREVQNLRSQAVSELEDAVRVATGDDRIGTIVRVALSGDSSPLRTVETRLTDAAQAMETAQRRALEAAVSQLGEVTNHLSRLTGTLEANQKSPSRGLAYEEALENRLVAVVEQRGDQVADVRTVPGRDGSKRGDYLAVLEGSNLKVGLELKNTSRGPSAEAARALVDDICEARDCQAAMIVAATPEAMPAGLRGIPFGLVGTRGVAVCVEPDGDQELLASAYAIARAVAVLDERRTSVTQTGDVDEALAAADEVRKRLAVLAESETSLKSIAKNTSAESKRIGNLTREALAQLELLADQVGKLPKAA